jgi:DNA modification methylase
MELTTLQRVHKNSAPLTNVDTDNLVSFFSKLPLDKEWAFAEAKRSDTSYITHDYHRYPAKFIPQLANKLISIYTKEDDIVCDPFMGSGTALVESIVLKRKAIGVDINPIAWLITKAKTTPIKPQKLSIESKKLLASIASDLRVLPQQKRLTGEIDFSIPKNERIDYWFPEKQKKELGIILNKINKIEDYDIRIFFLCAFSNILKNCSRWLMKSIKPTRDKNKKFGDTFKIFSRQVKRMVNKNKVFYELLNGEAEVLKTNCVVKKGDAREIPAKDNSVSLIVTSPPYVTSYEYADLHQLSAFWLEYIKELQEFRKNFIGSIQKEDGDLPIKSKLAKQICSELRKKNRREAIGVERYFFEMQECFEEMYRVLKPKGKACIVIGDTELKKVKIFNAEVFVEIMQNLGFKLFKVIKRPIPSKILPLTRDSKNGRFTSTKNADRLAYPFEYIVIMEK